MHRNHFDSTESINAWNTLFGVKTLKQRSWKRKRYLLWNSVHERERERERDLLWNSVHERERESDYSTQDAFYDIFKKELINVCKSQETL